MAMASSTSPKLLLDLQFPSKPSSRATIVCNSSRAPPPPPSPPTPSLSDQLKPLAVTLLKDSPKPSSIDDLHPPKPIWINPSRPKPSVLSLRRHERRPYSHNPNLPSIARLSRSLSSLPDSDLPAALAASPPPSREDALLLLNSLRPWSKAHLFFLYLKANSSSPLETLFYNVTMKALRAGRQFSLVEQLAHEMLDLGVELDNVTYSTIITTAKRCHEFDKAILWFERMYETGVMPDEVTYSAVLDVYANLGKKEEVIGLYERARAAGWIPDQVAFSLLAKMFGQAGDYDGIRYVLREMDNLGVKPNLIVYNTLLEALGNAGKPGLARSLFEEMVSAGVSPDEKTLTALIKIYGKARWSRDALQLWERMRSNNWPMDFILYNTLLSMCADVGLVDEAERLFGEMKRPDRWSYTAMIKIYGSVGKVERARELFDEMLHRGVEPSVMAVTCLIQSLGKGKRIGDAVKVFEIALRRGIKPDDRLCCCLLSLVSMCEDGEVDAVLGCLEKGNGQLVEFVKMLGSEEVGFAVVKEEFQGLLNEASVEVRRPVCNCLIDVCRNRSYPVRRARELFYLGTVYGLYAGLHEKGSDEWSLNLRSLSVGAAKTAFEEWMKALSSSSENEEVFPQVFAVHTGSGIHKFSQGLTSAFAEHLKELAAPFQQDERRAGCFVVSKDDLFSWMESRIASPAVAA